jgi:hypothetical protein
MHSSARWVLIVGLMACACGDASGMGPPTERGSGAGGEGARGSGSSGAAAADSRGGARTGSAGSRSGTGARAGVGAGPGSVDSEDGGAGGSRPSSSSVTTRVDDPNGQAFDLSRGRLNVDYPADLSKHDIVFNHANTNPLYGLTGA